MQDVTIQLADDVVTRIAPMRNRLSTVLELTLIGFKTPADELEKVEHIMIMLKAQVASQKHQSN